jgi:hypothetical protein
LYKAGDTAEQIGRNARAFVAGWRGL